MSLSPRGTVITIPREVEIKVHRGHKGFWTLLEKLAGQLTDGQQPWLSYKQPPSPPWSTRLNDLIPYITIPLTISPYSIDITLTNECETDSLAVMIPGEQSKKARGAKEKRILHTFLLRACQATQYMHHLSTLIFTLYIIFWRKMSDTTHVD